jgi:hypothetical protein
VKKKLRPLCSSSYPSEYYALGGTRYETSDTDPPPTLTRTTFLHATSRSAFFLQTDRPEPPTPLPAGQPKPLTLSPSQTFTPQSYYTWFISPSPLTTYLGSALLVLILLAGVMFPLWPPSLRLGVYYLSLGVLGLIGVFIGIAVVRLIIWVGTSLVMKRGIWWFPNLFEDVGFVSHKAEDEGRGGDSSRK